MRSKVLKPLDFSAFINGTDAMKTEQTTAERMCYIVNDKDLSQQAKEYFAQIRKTDRLIHRLDSTIATLRSSLTSTGSQLKQDKVQTSGPKNIGRCSSMGKSAVTGCGGSKVFKTLKATCFLVRQHGGERCWNRLGSPNPVPISPFGNGEKSAR